MSPATMKRIAIGVSLGTLLFWAFPAAQTRSSEVFEVASIRRSSSIAFGVRISPQPGGTFIATNVSLLDLVTYAYGVQTWERVEGDEKILSERFDVNAKAGRDVPLTLPTGTGPFNRMVQSLLAERFKLAVQWQEREEPVLELVLNRRDGALGAGLRPSDLDCAAWRRERNDNPRELAQGEGRNCTISSVNGRFQAKGHSMAEIATALSRRLQRPVFDRTGLSGPYHLEMTYSNEGLPPPFLNSPAGPPIPRDGSSLTKALEEQAGLKLESRRRPVRFLRITHVERLIEN